MHEKTGQDTHRSAAAGASIGSRKNPESGSSLLYTTHLPRSIKLSERRAQERRIVQESELYDYALIHRNTEKTIGYLRKAGLKYAICFEDQTLPNLISAKKITGTDGIAYGQEVMSWLGSHWFTDPAYLKVDQKPVLLVFGPQFYKDDAWPTLFSGLPAKPAFYTLHHRRSVADGAFDWPLPAADQGMKAVDAFYKRAVQLPVSIPVAFPRFHDIYKEAGTGPSYGSIEDQNGKTFESTLDRALASKAQIVQIATWNDWGEGTIIEPSVEFGYRDLEKTQFLRRKYLDPSFRFIPADLRLPLELYNLRKRLGQDPASRAALDEASSLLFRGEVAKARAKLQQITAKRPTSRTNAIDNGTITR